MYQMCQLMAPYEVSLQTFSFVSVILILPSYTCNITGYDTYQDNSHLKARCIANYHPFILTFQHLYCCKKRSTFRYLKVVENQTTRWVYLSDSRDFCQLTKTDGITCNFIGQQSMYKKTIAISYVALEWSNLF